MFEALAKMLKQIPFVPFTLHLASGAHYLVAAPEMATVSPGFLTLRTAGGRSQLVALGQIARLDPAPPGA